MVLVGAGVSVTAALIRRKPLPSAAVEFDPEAQKQHGPVRAVYRLSFHRRGM
jgi:hypothetical protein